MLNAMAVGTGWVMTLPVLLGLAIGDVVLDAAWLFLRRRRRCETR
jgi:hypothetical protein